MPHRIWGLYPQVQSTRSRFLQGEGRVDTLAESVPHEEEQLPAVRVDEREPLAGVVQQEAHAAGWFSQMDMAHDATIEERVPEIRIWKP